MVLSTLGPPPLRESPDPSSRTLGPTQLVSHGFPWVHPNVRMYEYPERAGIPILNGVITPHSDLPETSASPTRVSAAVTGMFHKRPKRHSTPSPHSSGLFPGLYATNLRPSDNNHSSPRRISEHPQTIFLYGSSVHTMRQS